METDRPMDAVSPAHNSQQAYDVPIQYPMAHMGLASPALGHPGPAEHPDQPGQVHPHHPGPAPAHQYAPAPPPGNPLAFRSSIPLNRRHKEDLEDPVDRPREWRDIISPYVSSTLWTLSGPVIRIIHQGTNCMPTEIYSFRIPDTLPNNLPNYLHRQEQSIKAFGVDKVIAFARHNGCNLADHPKLTVSEWAIWFTTSCLTKEAKNNLGSSEAGLWVFHHHELLQKQRGLVYEDGSVEEYYVVKAYVNLVSPSFRTFTPPEGWNPPTPKRALPQAEPGPAEKRARSQGPKKATGHEDQKEVKREPPFDLGNQTEQDFPVLPRSQGQPGGVTPWHHLANDRPRFV